MLSLLTLTTWLPVIYRCSDVATFSKLGEFVINLDLTASMAIHLRLLAGDPTATDDCVALWLPKLVLTLSANNPQVSATDDHFITTAAIDALLEYTCNPHKYDPQRSSLAHYLLMSAQGDLRNALRRNKTQRRDAISMSVQPVELILPDRNTNLERDVMTKIEAEDAWRRVLEAIDDPIDRQMLGLILQGERSTGVFAKVLEIDILSLDEQKAIVKRHKDRISKRLERLGKSIHE